MSAGKWRNTLSKCRLDLWGRLTVSKTRKQMTMCFKNAIKLDTNSDENGFWYFNKCLLSPCVGALLTANTEYYLYYFNALYFKRSGAFCFKFVRMSGCQFELMYVCMSANINND